MLKHRGAGKLPLCLAHLPPSLTSLAVKKVVLTLADGQALDTWREEQRQLRHALHDQEQQEQQLAQQQEGQEDGAGGEQQGEAWWGSDEGADSQQQLQQGAARDSEPCRPLTPAEASGSSRNISPSPLPPRPPSRGQGLAPKGAPSQRLISATPHAESAPARPRPPPLAPSPSSSGPSHAVESPAFNRAVQLGSVSFPDLTQLAQRPSAAGGRAQLFRSGSFSGAGAEGAVEAAGVEAREKLPAAEELAPCLCGLRALFLHTSLMASEVAACVARASTQLTQLAVVGPEASPGEEQEAWLKEALAGRLRAVQVSRVGGGHEWGMNEAFKLHIVQAATVRAAMALAEAWPLQAPLCHPPHQQVTNYMCITPNVLSIPPPPTPQVLDLSVPDSWSSTPSRLSDALSRLPRLRHLHLNLASGPAQLEHLTALTRLKTLAVDYAGPPALKASLHARLEAALPGTKVQLWEQLRVRAGGGEGAGGEARGGGGRRWWRVVQRGLLGSLLVAAVAGAAMLVMGRRRRRGWGGGAAGGGAAT